MSQSSTGVSPAEYLVPLPSELVFHPQNFFPSGASNVQSSIEEFGLNFCTVSAEALPFALYVTEYE